MQFEIEIKKNLAKIKKKSNIEAKFDSSLSTSGSKRSCNLLFLWDSVDAKLLLLYMFKNIQTKAEPPQKFLKC